MARFIIVKNISGEELQEGVFDLEDVVVCYFDGEMKYFESKGAAKDFIRNEDIEGRIIKLEGPKSGLNPNKSMYG